MLADKEIRVAKPAEKPRKLSRTGCAPICSRVLRYARTTGRKCEDVAADLIGLLVPVEPESMSAIVDPLKIGGLLRAMHRYAGEPLTRRALRLVRPE